MSAATGSTAFRRRPLLPGASPGSDPPIESPYLHAPLSTNTAIDPRALMGEIGPFRQSRTARSLFELAITAAPFTLLWLLTWAALDAGYMAGLLLTVPAGAFLLRLFLIQHDCGHGAFFRRQASNDWLGRILGVLTLTPYDYWRRSHAIHHASTGNLDARGTGDVDTLTVAEFHALGLGRRSMPATRSACCSPFRPAGFCSGSS